MRTLEFLLLAVGIALLPIYVSKSGGIQPAHAVLAIFAGSLILRHGFPRAPWALFLLMLAVYILVVELFYSLDGWTYSYKGKTYFPIINGVFFLYNCVIGVAVYGYCRRSGLDPVLVGVFFATIVAMTTVMVSGVDLQGINAYGRSTGSFNNPNQLGFFAVCLLSITYLLYRQGYMHYIVATALFFSALFLSVASMSRASVFANLVVFFLVLQPRMSKKATYFWGFAAIVVISLLSWFLARGAFDDFAFLQRYYENIDETDSSLEGRGYLAFLQANTVQFFFGLGAHNVHRIVGHEVHSTVVSVLSGYGIVGVALFASVLVMWAKRLWSSFGIAGVVCIAGPAMLYGITHNGTRFTFFWLLFAASLAAASNRAHSGRSLQSLQYRYSGPTAQIG